MLCIGAKNYAQNVNIPDAIFKAALVGNAAINTNGDSEIQVSEASTYTGIIDVSNLGISDLTGIAAFIQLDSLYCHSNNLSQLDVSNNINLTQLICAYNMDLSQLNLPNNLICLYCFNCRLSQLDVSNNINLAVLDCSYNLLSQLNLNNNINLIELVCSYNPLSQLNLNNNINLIELVCRYNQLSQLNVSNNIYLEILVCGNNNLSQLNISNNINLIELVCFNNNLSQLDISNNIYLIELFCFGNNLSQLDISHNIYLNYLSCSYNDVSQLDISHNIYLTYLLCADNPNLFCIQVWDTSYANTNWTVFSGSIDPQMYFSLDCNYTSTAENLASSLSILPNPASDYLYISYEGEKKLSFAISDIWGKTLAAWEAHSAGAFYEKEVPIADFPVGIYFLSVQAGDKKVVKKFVKE